MKPSLRMSQIREKEEARKKRLILAMIEKLKKDGKFSNPSQLAKFVQDRFPSLEKEFNIAYDKYYDVDRDADIDPRFNTSISKVFESLFHPETPGGRNNHINMTLQTKSVDIPPSTDNGEMMSDEEIDDELQLELKLGPTMRDPLNLPGWNMHNGSFSNGMGTSFANYKTNLKSDDTAEDTAVRTIEVDNSETLDEDVGMREKAGTESAFQTTKQPFANGMPKVSDTLFMDEDEISRELGLSEWISSTSVYSRYAPNAKSDLEFFDKLKPGKFVMNSIEDFEANQKKVKHEKAAKKKQRKNRK